MSTTDQDPTRSKSVAFNPGQYQLENTLSNLLEKHANEFKTMHERFQGREDDDFILFRYLKAFKFDVDMASTQLEATLKWRQEVDFESIKAVVQNVDPNDPEAFPCGKMIKRYFPQCPRYSEDRDGNIVGMIYPGLAVPNEIAAHISPPEMQLHETYAITNLSLYIGELSRQRGVVVRMTKIIDMKGFGIKHISSKAMIDATTASLSIAQSNFVEHMSRIIIINAPVIFNAVWALLKPVLSERTQKKVIVCGSDYSKTLLKYIAPDQLPVSYGGTCTREPVEVFDHNAGFETFAIPAGGSVEKSVQVDAGTILEWAIRSEGKDIGLSVDFNDSTEPAKDPVVIHPPGRIPSNSHTVVGSWTASPTQSGSALFKFDNSYSRFTSKVVKVRIDTTSPLNT